MREHRLLFEMMPVAQEMGTCLRDERRPDPEELKRWLSVEEKVHRSFGELSESIAGIERMVLKHPHNLDG